MSAPQPVFEAPWHAEAFAIAVHLNVQGVFDWPEWTKRFGAALEAARVGRDLDGGDDYFLAWVETLETICVDKGVADAAGLAALKAAWREAYLSTPHGAPVRLD